MLFFFLLINWRKEYMFFFVVLWYVLYGRKNFLFILIFVYIKIIRCYLILYKNNNCFDIGF